MKSQILFPGKALPDHLKRPPAQGPSTSWAETDVAPSRRSLLPQGKALPAAQEGGWCHLCAIHRKLLTTV